MSLDDSGFTSVQNLMPTEKISKYEALWPAGTSDLKIEMACIKHGGKWTKGGRECGEGLFHHFKATQKLIWPEDDHHRWSDLILKEYLANRITVVVGSRDSGKTRGISKAVLIDYYCFPEETLTLMTSTNIRGLELRVWGDIKSLHQRALDRYHWLPGNISDSKHGIFTDAIEETGDIRDQRKGILTVPVLGSHGEFMGESLKDFSGIKQKRRRLIGDELQFLPRDYLKVLDSLDKGDFKAAFLGNPIAENGKALDAVSEPKCGWEAQGEITKTTVWDNKYNGRTVNLVGIDSPNFDPETPNRFPYLVDQHDVDRVSSRPGGKDSIEWWSQIMGVRKAGAVSSVVLTIPEIEACDGFKQPVWDGSKARTRIYSIDAGFGGDECVETWLEFGKLVDGSTVISFGEQRVIPILLSLEDADGGKVTAERQIAKHAKSRCATLNIPSGNVFFDAGMFATLAVEMAREMSVEVNAVNFGGVATDRAVSKDMYLFEHDTHKRRLKTWNEHVSKFVTELWFVVRLVTQCHQIRQFPREAAEEFSRRQWTYVSRDRYELETKDDYKLRNSGESPNRADSLVIAVEGARRRGFNVSRLANAEAEQKNTQWFQDLAAKATTHTSHELVYR